MSTTCSRPGARCLALLALALLAACGGGGGGGGGDGGVPTTARIEVPGDEPGNNAFGGAVALSATRAGAGGVIAPGDVDYWSFAATANEVVQIELHGARRDQAGWDAGPNSPVVTLFQPDGVTPLTTTVKFSGDADYDVPAVRIPADGTYYVSVAQATPALPGSLYALLVKTVGLPTPVAVEAEGAGATGVNDTSGTAQGISPGTVRGWHVDGESDFYSFFVGAPATVCFEVLAWRNGRFAGDGDAFNSRLTLYDTNGATQLHVTDDCLHFDACLCYRLELAGTYFIEVDDFVNAGDGEYYLFYENVGVPIAVTETEPNDTPVTADTTNYEATSRGTTTGGDPDYFKFFGNAGDVVSAQFFDVTNSQASVDDVSLDFLATDGISLLPSTVNGAFGGTLQVVRTVLPTTGEHFVRVLGFGVLTDYSFHLTRHFGSTPEAEPNDTAGTAQALPAGGRAYGEITPGGDFDFYSFGAVAGEVVRVNVYGGATFISWIESEYNVFGSALAPSVAIFDTTPALLALSTRTPPGGTGPTALGVAEGLPTVSLAFVAPAAGTYLIRVGDQGGLGSPLRYYVVEKK